MKIVTLNLWGGRKFNLVKDFLKKYKDNIDIFCFQEVYHEGYGKDTIWLETELNSLNYIKEILDNYECFYNPHLGDWWGLAMFVKKDIKILSSGETYVYQEKGYNMEIEVYGHTAKNIQYITLEHNDKKLNIMNFHGLWNGQGKEDTETRIEQSKKIIEFLKSVPGEIILSGDFNLKPDTMSLKMLEDFGLKNLIKEFKITSTRTSFYEKEEKFADYVFITDKIKVKEFKILEDEVSDHGAMYLDFD